MRQLKGKPKENAKEKKERKKEFAENREKAFSVGDYYLYKLPNNRWSVNTLNIFSSSHPGRLFRSTCDARLLSHKTQDNPYGRDVNCVINKWGWCLLQSIIQRNTLLLATDWNVLIETAITVHYAPLCVCLLLLFTFLYCSYLHIIYWKCYICIFVNKLATVNL